MGIGVSTVRDQYGQLSVAAATTQGFDTNIDVTSRTGTTVTANATVNTVGSYSELIASTTNDTSAITLLIYGVGVSGAQRGMLVNLATGGAGSESDFISNINAVSAGGSSTQYFTGVTYFFPGLNIPSGTRISANCQADLTVDTVEVIIFCHS